MSKSEPAHGTRTRYVHRKCKCPRCVKANREYGKLAQRAYRAKKAEALVAAQ